MKKPNEAEPDVLVMTATPIPRTLALTLYGDLDSSVLDTAAGAHARRDAQGPGERAEDVWNFVRKQSRQKRQAYIVYPVIEGARTISLSWISPSGKQRLQLLRPGRRASRLNNRCFNSRSSALKPELRSATEMYDQLRAGACTICVSPAAWPPRSEPKKM